jgi:ADP-heptose:LPS heptosyltransferase
MRINRKKNIPISAQLRLLVVFAYLRICNGILNFFKWLFFKKNPAPTHILIFRTGSLGDNICAIPSIAAIRKHYPQARIDILVNSGASNLVSLEQLLHHDYYDEIINYLDIPRTEVIKLMRSRKYDLVIQLPQTGSPFIRLLRDLFFYRLICKSGFGWTLSTVPFFRRTQENYVLFDNETKRLAILLKQFHIEVDQDFYPLNFNEADRQVVDRVYEPVLQTGRPSLAIVAGAKRPQNRWPAIYFQDIIDQYRDRYNIILIGGPEDANLLEPMTEGASIFNFCGKLSPLQSALMLKKCNLVVSNDTGPMHLAYAVGVPLIAIFSSRDFPGKWFPPENPKNAVFRSYGVPCSLCLSETCGDNICMKRIKSNLITDLMNAKLNL